MAKFKPGIPDSFTLNVDPVRDLGDYLDEPRPVPAPSRKPKEESAPLPTAVAPAAPSVTSATVEVQVLPESPVVSRTVTVPANTIPPREETEREERGGKSKGPRREISMTPETLRMSDELLDVVRSGSGQRDTKANELFHALVLLVYEAIDDIDPHTIPKRGRWGTPTARAYPLELKNAFLRALLEKYAGEKEGLAGLKYPVNTAA